MQLSKPLYESLPWLYVLGGALLIGVSHQLHSGALSVLLLAAGVLAVIGGAAIWLRIGPMTTRQRTRALIAPQMP